MISAGEFRNGVTFELEGNVFQIVEFQHVKPGKGAAFVRTKLKNVITGGVVEKTFRPTEKMPKAHIKFVKENMVVKVLSYKGNVFGVEPPTFVELEVTETEPGFKGDTSTGATKPATLETGATIMVPLFVDQHDFIRVDTRTGEYMERV